MNARAGQSRAPAPLLSFHEVGKTFPGGIRALDGVCFDVSPGEFCVLLGPSGSGKTTLLRAVNGLNGVTSGEVRFRAAAIVHESQRAVCRRVSMIHQQFNLVPRLSVAANVLSGAIAIEPLWRTALGWYSAPLRARSWELVRRMGLGREHLFRRAQDLSGGQQQRVGIARALMADPDLILADEPVASLDPRVSRDIMSLLRSAARERGVTVLCSLHDLGLAREFADHVVGLHAGQVVFDGVPARLDAAAVDRLYGMNVMPLAPAAPREHEGRTGLALQGSL